MSRIERTRQLSACFLVLLFAAIGTVTGQKADNTAELRALMDLKEQRVSEKEAEGGEKKAIADKGDEEIDVSKLKFPEDTTTRFAVKEIQISGNTLITAGELLSNMPAVYSTSDKPLGQAPPSALYDFRVLREIAAVPGQEREVSERTMLGFTRYIL